MLNGIAAGNIWEKIAMATANEGKGGSSKAGEKAVTTDHARARSAVKRTASQSTRIQGHPNYHAVPRSYTNVPNLYQSMRRR